MKLRFALTFLVIILIAFAGCSKVKQPEQIIIEPEKEPEVEAPQEIVEEVTQEPESPKKEEKPLPKATISEEISSKYVGAVDIKYFPNIFVALNKDNKKVFNGLLVVGKGAPLTDVIAAQNVAAGVNNGIRRPGYMISAVLDSQVDDIKVQNAIVIGNPCDNTVAAVLLGNNECDANLQKNKALVKLYENNGFIQMVVVGNDAQGTLKASQFLKEYYKYELQGIRYEFTY